MPSRYWDQLPQGANVAKTERHNKCKDSQCIMCMWHDKFKMRVQELIDEGCPIAHAQIKWYSDDRHMSPDNSFNTYIESMVYGTTKTKKGSKDEDMFTYIATHYKSICRPPL